MDEKPKSVLKTEKAHRLLNDAEEALSQFLDELQSDEAESEERVEELCWQLNDRIDAVNDEMENIHCVLYR
jgi:chaperonin cofactor prefoldin